MIAAIPVILAGCLYVACRIAGLTAALFAVKDEPPLVTPALGAAGGQLVKGATNRQVDHRRTRAVLVPDPARPSSERPTPTLNLDDPGTCRPASRLGGGAGL